MATEEQCRERERRGERHFDGRKILAPVSGNPQPPSRYNLWYEFQNPRSLPSSYHVHNTFRSQHHRFKSICDFQQIRLGYQFQTLRSLRSCLRCLPDCARPAGRRQYPNSLLRPRDKDKIKFNGREKFDHRLLCVVSVSIFILMSALGNATPQQQSNNTIQNSLAITSLLSSRSLYSITKSI